MPVFRVERTRDYTIMANHHLRNRALSLKAKGLLSMMLSLPEDWDYTLKGLSIICKEGVDAIREAVRELERTGYISRSRSRNDKGQLGSAEYVIYERPQNQPDETPDPPSPKKKGKAKEHHASAKAATEKAADVSADEAQDEDAVWDALAEDLPVFGEPILDEPTSAAPTLDAPMLENPTQDFSVQENPTQLNTNRPSTQEPTSLPFLTDSKNNSKINPSINQSIYQSVTNTQPQTPRKSAAGPDSDEYKRVRSLVRNNIGYYDMAMDCPYDMDRIKEIADLMIETLCSSRPTIRVASDELPAALVKERLERINVFHLDYVMDSKQTVDYQRFRAVGVDY